MGGGADGMGGSLQPQEDVSSNPNLSFCSSSPFIPSSSSPPSGACLSPSNQGTGKEGEEDPGLTPPSIPGKEEEKRGKI